MGTARISTLENVKAGFYLNGVFWLGIMVLTQTPRSRFKHPRISSLILCSGLFCTFFADSLVYLVNKPLQAVYQLIMSAAERLSEK